MVSEHPVIAERLHEQLKVLPARPGVYLMRDKDGKVIYVGKAAFLRDRVSSYFGSQEGHPPKVRTMVSHIADLEFIVTDSEVEALILENNLIKRYHPPFNVRLRDDKSYPYIKIDIKSEWPRVYMVRGQERDGARYFGPFTSSRSVRETLDLLKRLFPYCTCDVSLTKKQGRPCLDYYINRCLAPCLGKVTAEDYRQVVNQVILFLEGKQERILKELRKDMERASRALEFEKAATLRDRVLAVEQVTEKQKINTTDLADQDVVALASEGGEACAQVFFVRNGKLIGREHFLVEGVQEEEPASVLSSFIEQFYDSASYIPPVILLQETPDEKDVLEGWLRERRGSRVELRVPQRGEKKKLVQMVADNARETLQQLRAKWLSDSNKTIAALRELQEALDLPVLPQRIECYDISNIHGSSAVGSMVVFINGQPKRAHYRRFRIKTVQGPDDYAMLKEVLRRRFHRAAEPRDGTEAAEAWSHYPELVMVDGGKGQLSSALEAMGETGVQDIPAIGLAKEREEVFTPGVPDPVILPPNSQALYLVQRIRDEAHRFALAYHVNLRQKRALTSTFDRIPGVGPKRKKALVQRFGSLQAVKDAQLEEIAAVPGMTMSLAQKVKELL
ncbi:MAG: excinuclease ABC subunit UvrC [Dehalococcoidia bacterium]|nr:excinuclease ABC subunit UvrC [Dehalococcoidia bacterium]